MTTNAPPHGSFRKEQLPILEKAVSVYKVWHGYFQLLPRLSRYTLGEKIDTLLTDLIELILKAGYSSRDIKAQFLEQASVKLAALNFFLLILWETKGLDNKKYLDVSLPLTEIGKMLGGWLKSLRTE